MVPSAPRLKMSLYINQVGEIEKEDSGIINGYSVNDLTMYHVAPWLSANKLQLFSGPTLPDLSQDSAVFQEMNFEWCAVEAVPEVGCVVEPSRGFSTIASPIQSPTITLHLNPSFENR